MNVSFPEVDWTALGGDLLVLAGVAVLGLALHRLAFRLVRHLSDRTDTVLDDALERHARRPSRWLFVLLALQAVPPLAGLGDFASGLPARALLVALVLAAAWLVIRLTRVVQEVALERFRIDVRDNLRARKIHTQLEILRKIVVVLVVVLAASALLMTSDRLQRLGTGLLASAGVAGLILGLAAQRTLGNLLAGIQLALTQPIRLDDVLVVEGEWGRVEEITLTYVVVRIWDLRRLVLPISYFIERPFQNWTRESAAILGTVFLYVDPVVPIGELREELGRILEESEHWDGEVWRLHVTDVTEKSVQVRALMSAEDSGTAWELRCEVREKLVDWLQREHPEGLPRFRAELEPPPVARARRAGDGVDEAAPAGRRDAG